MWKRSACSKYTVAMQTTAVFARDLIADICLMLAIWALAQVTLIDS